MDSIRGAGWHTLPVWTGSRLLSRTGQPSLAPQSFQQDLPADMALDGELCLERGRVEEGMSMARSAKRNEQAWEELSFMVFDSPGIWYLFTSHGTNTYEANCREEFQTASSRRLAAKANAQRSLGRR